MCHDDDSRPPAPPVVGEVAEHGRLVLTAAEGTALSAYRAVPGSPLGRGVVILPDVRGLHPYYEALAVRFAEAGFHAVAIDYFGRTAGTGSRDDSFDYAAQLSTLTPEGIATDAGAGIAEVQRMAGPDAAVFSVGFCMGGSHSWRLAATDLPLSGCIGFYGRPGLVADVEERFAKPLLLLVAGADRATPLADNEAFDARLTAVGVAHEMHVYDGAPHSFFDRAYAEWRDACDDAWRRILAFTEAHG